jgi:hypothetical protein
VSGRRARAAPVSVVHRRLTAAGELVRCGSEFDGMDHHGADAGRPGGADLRGVESQFWPLANHLLRSVNAA